MDEANKLLNYMEEHNDEFLMLLKRAVILESPTEGSKEDLRKCREYFSSLFTDIGFQCQTIPSNDKRYGDHLFMELGEGDEQILFVGHYDTVYSKGAFGEVWKQKGNKIWGPGVLDMKGGNIQVYMVAKALKELNLFPANKKICFLLTADEEAGSYASYMHYEQIAKKSKAAFVMESAKGDNEGGLKIGRYGRGNYTFIAEGQSAHSGQEPEKAVSALIELAQLAVYLEGLTDEQNNAVIACVSLNSGKAGWPTVPGDGELTVDARFSSTEVARKYDELFKNIIPFNPEVELKIQGGIEKPPFDEKEYNNKMLYERAKQIGRKFNLEVDGIVTRGGSDGNFTAAAGCPTLDGMGMSGNYLHQPGKEYININHISKRSAFVARLVLDVFNS